MVGTFRPTRGSALVGVLLLLAACTAAPATKPAAAPPASAPPAPAAAGGAPGPAPAGDEGAVARFYQGKTVRIVVGFAPGGGFDTYSRLIGRHVGKYIPGNPNVLVDNMPGGGSLVAANHLYNAGPKDGTLIVNFNGSLLIEQLFGTPGVEFDMAKMRYVALPVWESLVLAATKRTGVAKFEDLLGPQGKQLVVGVIPASGLEHAAVLTREVLGANLKVVSGYDGTAKIRLAISTGEVDALFNTWQSVKITNRADVESGEWIVLATLADAPPKDLPNAPPLSAIARTDEQRQLLRYGASVPNAFGKIYALAPEVPADRAAALEAAFRQTFADPEFLAEAEKAQLEIEPMFGEEMRKLAVETLSMSPDLKAKLRALMQGGR